MPELLASSPWDCLLHLTMPNLLLLHGLHQDSSRRPEAGEAYDAVVSVCEKVEVGSSAGPGGVRLLLCRFPTVESPHNCRFNAAKRKGALEHFLMITYHIVGKVM